MTTSAAQDLVAALTRNSDAFLAQLGGVCAGVDRTDGLRVTLTDGRIVHLRPSGNAPELRLYVEADTADISKQDLDDGLNLLRVKLTQSNSA